MTNNKHFTMKIAILNRKKSYSSQWIAYCIERDLDYKIINPYSSSIIQEVADCDIIMWHHAETDYRDMLFAKQLLYALEQSGKIVYPNFKTGWHFDDKVGEKYLFEALGIKSAEGSVFYTKNEAYKWIETVSFPKVFKLRGGAGAKNVYLAHSEKEAKKFVRKAFSSGFPQYNRWRNISDRIKAYKEGHLDFISILKGFGRLFFIPQFAKMRAPEKGYAYFQEFIPNDGYDFRVEVIGEKAIACVRYCRKNDFRASGGHNNHFENPLITPDVIQFAFEVADAVESQSIALDIVRNKETNKLYLIETSYCFGVDEDEFDHGFFDRNGVLNKIPFNGLNCIMDVAIYQYKSSQSCNENS